MNNEHNHIHHHAEDLHGRNVPCEHKHEDEHNHSHSHEEKGNSWKILLAFILNLSFSVFELIGGIFCGSVAIASDAVHDFGDATSIGISYFLERKSRKKPNDTYTYGYMRFSVLGAFITNAVLLIGSVTVIWASVERLLSPSPINYSVMIIFAVVGLSVNLAATIITSKGESLNERSINLHMLEDVVGWAVVLAGSVVMRFTDFYFIDAIMSMGVSVYMLWHVFKNMREIGRLFLVKIPESVSLKEIRESLLEIEGIADVHHIHVWSMSESAVYCTLHIVTNSDSETIKSKAREILKSLGVAHATLELESVGEKCCEEVCVPVFSETHGHHHHHH